MTIIEYKFRQKFAQPLAAEDIVMASLHSGFSEICIDPILQACDGYCGSACAIFSESIQSELHRILGPTRKGPYTRWGVSKGTRTFPLYISSDTPTLDMRGLIVGLCYEPEMVDNLRYLEESC